MMNAVEKSGDPHLPGAPVFPQKALLKLHQIQEERFGKVVQGIGRGQVRK